MRTCHRIAPWFLLLACGAPQPPARQTPRPQPPPSASAQTPATPAPSQPQTATPSPADAAPAFQTLRVLDFERSLAEPITSVAVGHDGRVAALAADPWLLDAGRWSAIALPDKHRPAAGEVDHVSIFFGRDNRPRLMGSRRTANGETRAVYLRWKNAGWRPEPSEIGRLGGSPAAGLFGVLGHDDPEVACKVADVCIVKRRTGWTTVPAGPGMPHVVMHDGVAWALHAESLARMGADGWVPSRPAPPWKNPADAWGTARGPLWVSVPGDDALYRFDGSAWSKHPSPVEQPRGLWGTSDGDLWVVGTTGAGHYDGSVWARVDGVQGPLVVATGAGPNDVWLGGPSGLWHGTKPGPG